MKIEMLTDDGLLLATRDLVKRDLVVTADLLDHLGEVDARKLYLGRAFPSMFAFCVGELGFSEDVAYNRIAVARLGRRLPAVLLALRSGRVHLTGLRILGPHFTEDNVGALLSEATGKPKDQIEIIAARLAPKPAVASRVRKLAARSSDASAPTLLEAVIEPKASEGPLSPAARVPSPTSSGPQAISPPRSFVKPLAEEIFKVQFTARRPLREKLKEAQDLLRHSVPDGDLAEIVERGLDLLVAQVKKERFAVGKKARIPSNAELVTTSVTRHVPDAIKRTVYERDGGQCTFVAADGRRCADKGGLELDHTDGFARTRSHSVQGIRLRCRAHNQHAADELYGRAFMDNARRKARATDQEDRARPGAGDRPNLDEQRAVQPLLL